MIPMSFGAAIRLDVIARSTAVIEFALDGAIMAANENFLAMMGYSLQEIKGEHHSMFVEPTGRESPEYRVAPHLIKLGIGLLRGINTD